MLVLTRRAGESIVIGNEIVVTVLEVRHDQIRLGISAPRSVQVHREEVYRQVAQSNNAAVASADRASALLRRRVPPGSGGPRPGLNRPDQAPPSKRSGGTAGGTTPG